MLLWSIHCIFIDRVAMLTNSFSGLYHGASQVRVGSSFILGLVDSADQVLEVLLRGAETERSLKNAERTILTIENLFYFNIYQAM